MTTTQKQEQNLLWSKQCANGLELLVYIVYTNKGVLTGALVIKAPKMQLKDRIILFSTPEMAKKVALVMLEDFDK